MMLTRPSSMSWQLSTCFIDCNNIEREYLHQYRAQRSSQGAFKETDKIHYAKPFDSVNGPNGSLARTTKRLCTKFTFPEESALSSGGEIAIAQKFDIDSGGVKRYERTKLMLVHHPSCLPIIFAKNCGQDTRYYKINFRQ